MSEKLPIRVLPLVEAHFGLDGGAMFGIIPKPLWTRSTPADAQNRIDLACRCLLVQYEDKNVLVDVGIGTRWTDKERKIYKITNQDKGLRNALALHDLTPDDIDDVVLTHLHFDHAGGLCFEEEGQKIAAFPKATHWLQERNWDWAHGPTKRDAGSYRKEDFDFFDAENAPVLNLIDGPKTLFPGFEVFPQFGHTAAMQICKIKTQTQTYFYLADLIPTSAHLRDPYIMSYDLDPLTTLREKRDLLHHAFADEAILIFEHDPIMPMGRLEKKNEKLSLIPVDA